MALTVTNYSNGEALNETVLNRPINEIVTYVNGMSTGGSLPTADGFTYIVHNGGWVQFPYLDGTTSLNTSPRNITEIENEQQITVNGFILWDNVVQSYFVGSHPFIVELYAADGGSTFPTLTGEAAKFVGWFNHTTFNIPPSVASSAGGTQRVTATGDFVSMISPNDTVYFKNLEFDNADTRTAMFEFYYIDIPGPGSFAQFYNCKFLNTGNNSFTGGTAFVIDGGTVYLKNCSVEVSTQITLKNGGKLITENTYIAGTVNVTANTFAADGLWIDTNPAASAFTPAYGDPSINMHTDS